MMQVCVMRTHLGHLVSFTTVYSKSQSVGRLYNSFHTSVDNIQR